MGARFTPVDPRLPRHQCPPEPNLAAYVRAGLYVGLMIGIPTGYLLAQWWR